MGSLPALLALYVCWGSSLPAMKVMVETIPPLAGAGAVFTLGGAVLLAGARGRVAGAGLPALRNAALAGAVLLVCGQGLGTVALTSMTASLTALIVAAIPLLVALIGALTGERTPRRTAACLLAGFAGIVLVVLTAPSAALGGSIRGLLITFAAVLGWAVGTHLAGRSVLPDDIRVSGGVQLVTGGVLLLGLAALAGQLAPAAWTDASGSSLAAAGFLLVADSVLGFLLYAHLLRTTPIATVSTYAYATPVIAAAIGFVVLGETFWWGAVAGGLVVLVAVAAQLRRAG